MTDVDAEREHAAVDKAIQREEVVGDVEALQALGTFAPHPPREKPTAGCEVEQEEGNLRLLLSAHEAACRVRTEAMYTHESRMGALTELFLADITEEEDASRTFVTTLHDVRWNILQRKIGFMLFSLEHAQENTIPLTMELNALTARRACLEEEYNEHVVNDPVRWTESMRLPCDIDV